MRLIISDKMINGHGASTLSIEHSKTSEMRQSNASRFKE